MWKSVVLAFAVSVLASNAWAENQSAPPESAEPSASHIALYQAFMELYGSTDNIRDAIARASTATETALLAKLKVQKLTPAQAKRFSALSKPAWEAMLEEAKLTVARTQSPRFTDADVSALIAAYSSEASRHYTNWKLSMDEKTMQTTNDMMVDTVDAILKATEGDLTKMNAKHPKDTADVDKTTLALARQLMQVAGTLEVTRHFVHTGHMPLIMAAVKRQLPDGYPAAKVETYEALAEPILAERIETLSAVRIAHALSAVEMKALVAAYDIPAQRKLTEMQLNNTGETDARLGQRFNDTANKVIADFMAGK